MIPMDDATRKLVFNIGGGVAGIVLAVVATFGVIGAANASSSQPQKYTSTINYDGTN